MQGGKGPGRAAKGTEGPELGWKTHAIVLLSLAEDRSLPYCVLTPGVTFYGR